MNLWGIFVTGLLAGGASCAAALRWNFLYSCRDQPFPEKPERHINGATVLA